MFARNVTHELAVTTPGQGSQSPGMLPPWLEVDGARKRLAEWSEATGLDLIRLGTEALGPGQPGDGGR